MTEEEFMALFSRSFGASIDIPVEPAVLYEVARNLFRDLIIAGYRIEKVD